MKTWKIAVGAVCVCFLMTMAYAATVGSPDDPLVTLGYLNNVFRGQVEEMADHAVESRKAELEKDLSDLIDGKGGSGGARFVWVTLSRGKTLVGDVGCEIVLRTGSATCASTDSEGLVDVTAGSTLGNGGALMANHLYMVTGGARSIAAGGDSVSLLVRGPYTIQ